MKVLVVGSLNFPGSDDPLVRQKFAEACRQIGAALAKSGHTIIIRSNHSETADRFVVEGANSVGGRHRVICYEPDRDAVPLPPWEEELNSIEFTRLQSSGPWPTDQVNQIMAADVIILIGGRRGTIQTAHVAPILGKPVLAIPSFGGTAAEAWRGFRADYRRVLDSPDQLEDLASSWRPGSADFILQAADQLAKRNPYKESYAKELTIGFGIVLSLGAWMLIFLKPFSPHIVSFVTLALLSSVLGACLRRLLGTLVSSVYVISWRELLLEVLSSLVLAFGLSLLYLVGGLTVTGDPQLIKMEDVNQFQRVGIVASLLGLSAGFVLEKAAKTLQARIEKLFR